MNSGLAAVPCTIAVQGVLLTGVDTAPLLAFARKQGGNRKPE
ncbi:MAG: hypothetical protein ACYS9C_13460 [Planctomycetota bacterium]